MAVAIAGKSEDRFSPVVEAFNQNFEDLGEVGAALCVYHRGHPVVDVWGGFKDAARTEPWQSDTIVNVYSVSKGITALCVHMLVDRKLLDLDTPVCEYWPEFSKNGKESVTPRHVLSHTAGLPAFELPMTPAEYYDWDLVAKRLANQAPLWEPGTRLGYQPVTYGHLAGELFRRASGRRIAEFLDLEVVKPLGGSFYFGVPAAQDHRIAEVIATPPQELVGVDPPDPDSLLGKALGNPPVVDSTIANSEDWRRAELPGANGHGDARTVAGIYGVLAMGGTLDDVTLIGEEALANATEEQIAGVDCVMNLEGRMALGFALSGGFFQTTPSRNAFGYPGAGGHMGFADPDSGIGFGYVANQMKSPPDYHDPRVTRIL
jgi:CubicO group peptidase (beta-lactamase class C family)